MGKHALVHKCISTQIYGEKKKNHQVTHPNNKSQTDFLFVQACLCIQPLLLATNDIHLWDCRLRESTNIHTHIQKNVNV